MSKQIGANKMIHENYGEKIEEFERVLQKVATNMLREEPSKGKFLFPGFLGLDGDNSCRWWM